jgi:hypothetical protein
MMEPSSALSRALIMPSKSSPFVCLEKYGYVFVGRPTFEKIWKWFGHVGSEKYDVRVVFVR